MDGMKLILGLGISGLSCANYFDKKDVQYRIFDTRNISDIDQLFISSLDKSKLYLQSFNNNILDNIDEVVISPGFDKNHEIFKQIILKSLPQVTDIDIFKRICKRPIISITGTNGKTTIVSMLEHIMLSSGIKTIACGNNGIPPLDINSDDYDYIILELSSYQLEYMCNYESYISMLANIDHDHLDRHDTIGNYLDIKLKIFKSCDYSLVNMTLSNSLKSNKNKIIYGLSDNQVIINNDIEEDISYDSLTLYYKNSINLKYKGIHNLENILGVCSIATILKITISKCLQALKSYNHLPHRIELIKCSDGICWYNDSKSTNTASTKAALECIKNNIILIIGGAKKDMNYKDLSNLINKKVKLLVFIGANRNYIKKQLDVKTKMIDAESIDDAVIICKEHALENNNVLLSPASASFDMFRNFEERGDAFKKAVIEYVK